MNWLWKKNRKLQLRMPSARLVLLGSVPGAAEHREEDAAAGRELGWGSPHRHWQTEAQHPEDDELPLGTSRVPPSLGTAKLLPELGLA